MDIKSLEQELADRLEAIELQKQRDAAEFEKKKRDREAAVATAQDAQRKKIEAVTKARIERERQQAAAFADWERSERDRRYAEDQANLKIQAEREQEEIRARELQEQLAQIEHAEEMRRRALEETLPPVFEPEEVISGPNGLTPTTSEMSDHLKNLLRQDRDFNV